MVPKLVAHIRWSLSYHIEDAVGMIGQQFVESILLSNEGSYVLITQPEVYYKDRKIDDASINNIQLVDVVRAQAILQEIRAAHYWRCSRSRG